MPSTHLSLHYHVVFSTKNREPWISPSTQPRLHEYIGGVVRGLGGIPDAVGGIADHVHILLGLNATHRLADVMREIKSESSKWMHQTMRLAGFAWQEGYGAFTVAAPDRSRVRDYVSNQGEHHRLKGFQEEYLAMLERSEIEFDSRYLW
ncbi:IS200/IS605 family transposase [Luteolibacter sp. LG18]|uniref:IS200/IS605 family transposase n=1 Tax=Luteolibacter sp. LG18 TaxID=2819286 RepID=UPI0030C6A8F2